MVNVLPTLAPRHLKQHKQKNALSYKASKESLKIIQIDHYLYIVTLQLTLGFPSEFEHLLLSLLHCQN